MRNRLAALVSVGLIVGGLSAKAQEDPFIRSIALMKRSVGLVGCFALNPDGTGRLIASVGTAFFVSAKGDFATAGHVILALPSGERCPFTGVYLPVGDWQPTANPNVVANPFTKDTCKVDAALDVAVCRTIDNLATLRAISIRPVTFQPGIQTDGTPVAFTGFPLDIVVPLTARGAVATYRPVGSLDAAEMIIDRGAWPGASGSPVFLSNGDVVGIVVETGVSLGAGLAYARTAPAIQHLLAIR